MMNTKGIGMTTDQALNLLNVIPNEALEGKAKRNRNITRHQAWGIFFAAVCSHREKKEELPHITARNIWREFGGYWHLVT